MDIASLIAVTAPFVELQQLEQLLAEPVDLAGPPRRDPRRVLRVEPEHGVEAGILLGALSPREQLLSTPQLVLGGPPADR